MNAEVLKLIMPKCPQEYADALVQAMPDYDINTPERIAAFIAQLAHESAECTRVEENMNYSADRLVVVFPKYFPSYTVAEPYHRKPEAIANKVYSNRMGNGNEKSGDGWKYHGRGPIQLTGRDNYSTCGEAIMADLINTPDLLLQPKEGVESACWYWKWRGLNPLADAGDFRTITKRINGGYHGLEERERYYGKARAILNG